MTHVILEVPGRDQRKEGVWLILGIGVNVMGRKKMLITQSCLILCDPVDCNPPGSSVHGISQARTLEWVAIFYSEGCSDPGIEAVSPELQADSLALSHLGFPDITSKVRSKSNDKIFRFRTPSIVLAGSKYLPL